MSDWFYYDKNGEKVGPITVAFLKELARRGVVTRETRIENINGRSEIAGNVRGLAFPEISPSKQETGTVPPNTPVSSPSPSPSPVSAKPFTAPKPRPVAAKPTVNQTQPMPQSNPVLPHRDTKADKGGISPLWIGGYIAGILILLLIGGEIGWAIMSSKSTPVKQMANQVPPKSTPTKQVANQVPATTSPPQPSAAQPPVQFTAAEQAEIDTFLITYGSALKELLEVDGTTLLHWAAGLGNLVVAKFLISQGADVNAKDNKGNTPLHSAALEGHDTPFYSATDKGHHIEVAKFLVSQGADVNTKNNEGYTPLHSAAYEGNIEIVKFLVSQGADVNAKDKNVVGTPLHVAALKGNVEVAKFLVSQGADVKVKGYNGLTPLDMAKTEKKTAVVEYLSGLSSTSTPARQAANPSQFTAEEQAEIDKFIAENGSDVKAVNKNGFTLLHQAAGLGQITVVEFLVSKGADVNAKNNNGYTPLHQAAYDGHVEVVKFLVSEEANVKAKDKDGGTPLHSAALMGNVEVAKFLVSKGVDVNAKNNNGKTPLDMAKGLVKELKELGKLSKEAKELGKEIENTAMIEYLKSVGGR